MKKTRSLAGRAATMLAALAILLGSAQMAGSAEPKGKPQLISVAAYDIGASAYNEPMGVGEGVLKKFGIKMRLLPLSNNLARMRAGKSRQVDFFVTSSDAVFARKGWHEWAARDWGPQRLRLIWQTNRSSSFSLAVLADSNIRTIADLKGKRVTYLVGSPSGNAITEAYLNFEGLTWKDVKRVDLPGYGASWRALAEGKVDACGGSTMNTTFLEIASGPHGIRFLELPYPPDHPGWKFFEEIYPTSFPMTVSLAAGLKKGQSIRIFSFPFPDILAYDFVDEDLAYWMLKAMVESYDEFKNISPTVADWNLERSLQIPLKLAPYHKGAQRYLKEIGKWTPDLQKAQENLLKEEEVYFKCSEGAKSAGAKKGVGEKEWPSFWKNYAQEQCGLKVRVEY